MLSLTKWSSHGGHCHKTVVCFFHFSSYFFNWVWQLVVDRLPKKSKQTMFRIKPVLFPPASLKKLVNTSHYLPRSQLILQTCRASSSNATTGNFTFLSQMYQDLSQSSWVMNTQHLLEAVHDYTHLPWWATIVVTTVSLRLAITLPLAAYQVIFYYNN